MPMLHLRSRAAEISLQDIQNLWLISFILKACNDTSKVIAGIIVSGEFIVNNIERVLSKEYISNM